MNFLRANKTCIQFSRAHSYLYESTLSFHECTQMAVRVHLKLTRVHMDINLKSYITLKTCVCTNTWFLTRLYYVMKRNSTYFTTHCVFRCLDIRTINDHGMEFVNVYQKYTRNNCALTHPPLAIM